MSKVKIGVAACALVAVLGVAYWRFVQSGPDYTEKAAEAYVPPADLSEWTAKDVRHELDRHGIVLPDHLDGYWVEDRFFSREEIYGNPVLNELGINGEAAKENLPPQEN